MNVVIRETPLRSFGRSKIFEAAERLTTAQWYELDDIFVPVFRELTEQYLKNSCYAFDAGEPMIAINHIRDACYYQQMQPGFSFLPFKDRINVLMKLCNEPELAPGTMNKLLGTLELKKAPRQRFYQP